MNSQLLRRLPLPTPIKPLTLPAREVRVFGLSDSALEYIDNTHVVFFASNLAKIDVQFLSTAAFQLSYSCNSEFAKIFDGGLAD